MTFQLKHMPRLARTVGALVVLMSAAAWPARAIDVLNTGVVQSERIRAELLAHAPEGAGAGKPVWLGLQLQHAKDWHTYWKNPGDSGLPTQLEWQLPEGVTTSDVDWPTPKKFPLGPLANFGYDGTVLLPVRITLPTDWTGQALTVGLNASWLACRTECIPEEGRFRVTVRASAPTALHGLAFEEAAKRTPSNIANKSTQSSVDGQFYSISTGNLPLDWRGKRLTFFPETPNLIEPGAAWEQAWQGDRWTARLPLSSLRTEAPAALTAVIAHNEGLLHGEPARAGVRLSAPVTGSWPVVTVPDTEGVSQALAAALERNATAPPAPTANTLGLWAALLGALVGGIILNLMPCVFPVLAIKVLAFTQHGDAQDPVAAARVRRSHRASGLAYTAGVVLSFAALGGLLVALRATGEQLGWGFQLQSPAVVASLAVLFTLIGLNLAGLFEFGSVLPSAIASLQAKHPTVDSFLTGVLATAVASPCTAPFMGASLGLAMGLPAPQALAVFGAIGLGMALPYLLASWVPGVAQALPRPGAWMNTFKQFMAFPMFGTVVWLVWVLGQQTGMNGAAALLAMLVTLALLVWAWGLSGRGRVWLSILGALGLAGLLYSAGPLVLAEQDAPQASGTPPPPGTWGVWSPQLVAELTQAGRTVFVDYTAAWCVTCQYNKRTTLSNPEVLADFAQRDVVLLRADWTRRDSAVTAALAAVGRSGVPTYVLHRAGQPPTVLSEVLGVSDIRQALAQP